MIVGFELMNTLLAVIGLFMTVAITLLGGIWSELRTVRKELTEVRSDHGTRLAVVETSLEGLNDRLQNLFNGDTPCSRYPSTLS